VEITSTARRSVSLHGGTLKDEDGRTYTFDHYRLQAAPRSVSTPASAAHRQRPLPGPPALRVWDNRFDTATLRNDRGGFIDDASWGHRQSQRPQHR
jgi:hypothetical protein